eukprot:TRINITY_DN57920_c0_g1_i1.p1 TRINITY_DN57920_c0_g1~~TRINITY_DN57920_c0_g1_i1.p1  ORF type:complete len:207 (-),score=64.67 TRINITY_DN57920_c0_g1_i1:54-674(-)
MGMEGQKRSAADILAAFRAKTEQKITDAQEENNFVLVSAAEVRRRRAAEAESWRRDLGYKNYKRDGRNDRKRLPDEALEKERSNMRRRTGQRKPRTKNVKISNIPAGIIYKYLKELFEKATGKIEDGHFDEETATAWFIFQRGEHAEQLAEDFDGGEISGKEIQVELLPENFCLQEVKEPKQVETAAAEQEGDDAGEERWNPADSD